MSFASISSSAQAIWPSRIAGKRSYSYRAGGWVGGDRDDAVATLGVAAEDGLRPLAGTVLLAPPLPVIRPVPLVEGRLMPCARSGWRRLRRRRRQPPGGAAGASRRRRSQHLCATLLAFWEPWGKEDSPGPEEKPTRPQAQRRPALVLCSIRSKL